MTRYLNSVVDQGWPRRRFGLLDVGIGAMVLVIAALMFFMARAPGQAHRSVYLVSLSLADGCLTEGVGRVTQQVLIGGAAICAPDRGLIDVDALMAEMRERLAVSRAQCRAHYEQEDAWLDRLTLEMTGRSLDWVCGAPADQVRIGLAR